MMPPSRKRPPACFMMPAISWTVSGAMALQSTINVCRPLARSASAASRAKSSAAPGFITESTTSHSATSRSIVPTSVNPASRARVRLRSLRLSSAVHTVKPRALTCIATACPMSPGVIKPTFSNFLIHAHGRVLEWDYATTVIGHGLWVMRDQSRDILTLRLFYVSNAVAQCCVFLLELFQARAQRFDVRGDLVLGEAWRDVLRTIPVESFEVQQENTLGNCLVTRCSERCREYRIVSEPL